MQAKCNLKSVFKGWLTDSNFLKRPLSWIMQLRHVCEFMRCTVVCGDHSETQTVYGTNSMKRKQNQKSSFQTHRRLQHQKFKACDYPRLTTKTNALSLTSLNNTKKLKQTSFRKKSRGTVTIYMALTSIIFVSARNINYLVSNVVKAFFTVNGF